MSPVIMEQWVVYDHPKDWPQYFVARKWIIRRDGYAPTDEVMMHPDLDTLRGFLVDQGLVMLTRSPEDEPVVLEVWL